MKFQFLARCDEQVLQLSVELPYQPGNQSQQARRMAVGELLFKISAEHAEVNAEGDERVVVSCDKGIWVIGEGGGIPEGRGAI